MSDKFMGDLIFFGIVITICILISTGIYRCSRDPNFKVGDCIVSDNDRAELGKREEWEMKYIPKGVLKVLKLGTSNYYVQERIGSGHWTDYSLSRIYANKYSLLPCEDYQWATEIPE